MGQTLAHQWQSAFWKTVIQPEYANPLREAGLQGKLTKWTTALTGAVVSTCETMGWQASAKGHPLNLFPVSPSEYLAIDVMAFESKGERWRFPIAVMELENSRDTDRSAYSLWKVLCIRSQLRVVFCYRRSAEERSSLLTLLKDEILPAFSLTERLNFTGETLIVVGSRGDSATFPYGFFKWWELEMNTATFRVI